MRVISTPKELIESQYAAIEKLQEECESCKWLRGKIAEKTYIYAAEKTQVASCKPAMLAIAKYEDNTYAVYAPNNLARSQFYIFFSLLQDLNENDNVIVFSRSVYDAIKSRSRKYGKPLKVKLSVKMHV